jgi:Lon protease-like protein
MSNQDWRTAFDGKSVSPPSRKQTMELPLFPLNTVLFPGMVLPLHIFEPRYREMINRCIEEDSVFGVCLIESGSEVGEAAKPHRVGTAARIVRVERQPDGRMNITAVGTHRFRILELDTESHSYLTGRVAPLPVVNGGTRIAMEMAQKVRPKIVEYVELLSKATNTQLKLDRLPEDPATLAFLTAIALQVNNEEKQKLLELVGVPEMLDRERYLLSWETLLLNYMNDTQKSIQEMSSGPTGYIFPN